MYIAYFLIGLLGFLCLILFLLFIVFKGERFATIPERAINRIIDFEESIQLKVNDTLEKIKILNAIVYTLRGRAKYNST